MRRRSVCFRIVCTLTAVCLAENATALAQIAQCYPPNGLYRVTDQHGESQTFSSAKSAFCSAQFLSWAKQNSTSVGVTVPIDDAPINGKFDANNQEILIGVVASVLMTRNSSANSRVTPFFR